jgi:hypothetical protein
MTARRTLANDGGWSAVAVHISPAEPPKEGFYLTLFPEAKQQVVFMRAQQLAQLVDMAASTSVSDAQLWEQVARIPLEPLLPNRALSAKLRALLVEQATPLREEIRVQNERRPPTPPAEEQPADDAQLAGEPPALPKPF